MIRVLCVGRVREEHFSRALAEYEKRLSRYAQLEIIEAAEEKAPENLSAAQRDQVKRLESARLTDKLREGELAVTLAPEGTQLSSEELAGKLAGWQNAGKSRIAFLIGGSLGLSDEALARADFRLSFSKMTFPHQLFRVMLLEQLYRAYKIIGNEPYHK
ncbi:MAG: Ribosomal RNA large subunit methyltransferase H [Firmicutes bacterium ADurb.Bin248]|nr:MAG: Ribosomal RNA large subunit methyltransferase H [Firmicutes bacterium ADurb.Bin248]HOG00716.1 23S rRNA (pseudouridine(1915)-N(3))-methyltransferase RlmH [Clostridia bacterium]